MLVLCQCDYFRSNVSWSATPKEQIFLEVSLSCQSVVHDNWGHGSIRTKHDVLRF